MKKVIILTGAKGIGKTTAAITHVPPSKIKQLFYIDTEDSASDLVGLGFKHIRMYDRFKLTDDMLALIEAERPPWVNQDQKGALVEYYDHLVRVLNRELEPGKYKYLAIDTVGPVEAAMDAALDANRQVFGWSGDKRLGRREAQGYRPLYEGLLEAISRRGVETIILTTHLKSLWVDNKPVLDKVKMGGRLKLLSMISSMMLWLVPGENSSGAPAALVLKARKGLTKPGSDGFWDTVTLLPKRMPMFDWRQVARYEKNPPDLASPADGEAMSPSEQEMISELLSDKSMELMIMNKRDELRRASAGRVLAPVRPTAGPAGAVDTKITLAAGMIKAGKSRAEIVKATGMSMGQIVKLEASHE